MCAAFYVSKIYFRHLSILILGLSHSVLYLKGIPFYGCTIFNQVPINGSSFAVKNNATNLCLYNFTCVSRAIELHLLDQKVCVFINLIDVSGSPVYTQLPSVTAESVSLHPLQVQQPIFLRVRLTVFSSVYFSVNCLLRFYTYFSIEFVFSIYRNSIYLRELFVNQAQTFFLVCHLIFFIEFFFFPPM